MSIPLKGVGNTEGISDKNNYASSLSMQADASKGSYFRQSLNEKINNGLHKNQQNKMLNSQSMSTKNKLISDDQMKEYNLEGPLNLHKIFRNE